MILIECANCGDPFREQDSDYLSLSQICGGEREERDKQESK